MKFSCESIKLLLPFICCILPALSVGQNVEFKIENFPGRQSQLNKALEDISKGDAIFYEEGEFQRLALPHYEKAYRMNSENAELNFKIGRCYLVSNNKFKAKEYLEKAYRLNPAVDQRIFFYLGEIRQLHGDWQGAVEAYSTHLQNTPSEPDRKATRKRIEECQSGILLTANPVDSKIENLGNAINSPFPDYKPLITADERIMYFTSRRPDTYGGLTDPASEEYFEDIYSSIRTNGNWMPARNIGPPVNSRSHDAGAGLSPDGHTMFVFKGDRNNGDLLISYLINGVWTKPEDPGKNINSKYHESSACLSPDGNVLYFVSDKPGGYGGRDIYKSQWNSRQLQWDAAENLGNAINTSYDEEGVFMHPDGKTLYFSSKGRNSMGGYDVFFSVFENGKWSNAENIGYPINTPDDDVFFVMSADKKHAYYSSVKLEGKGDNDIYMITFAEQIRKPSSTTLVKGVVRNMITKEPLAAQIELTDLSAGQHIGNYSTDSRDGSYLISLPSGRNYGAVVYANGYLFESANFEIAGDALFEERNMDFEMKPMTEGFNMILTNIFFDTDKYEIKKESENILQRVALLMKEYPKLQVEISGHTDSQGDEFHNLTLSENRARAVVEFLVKSGIDRHRLSYIGYGETKPITDNATPEGRQRNRRIEFKITSN